MHHGYITSVDYDNNTFEIEEPEAISVTVDLHNISTSVSFPVEAGDVVKTDIASVGDSGSPQIVTDIEMSIVKGSIPEVTVATIGSESPITLISPIVEDNNADFETVNLPSPTNSFMTSFTTDIDFECDTSSNLFEWTQGTITERNGNEYEVTSSGHTTLTPNRTYVVAYVPSTKSISIWLLNNFFLVAGKYIRIGTINIKNGVCILDLPGSKVTEDDIVTLNHAGSSTTTIREHDTLQTPQLQTPTLGNDPNFRTSYNSSAGRWELSWDTFEYDFRNGKVIDIQGGTVAATDGSGTYFAYIDVPVLSWDTMNAINLQSSALKISKDLTSEFETNTLYKIRLGSMEVFPGNVNAPSLIFLGSATVAINASFINAGQFTADRIGTGAIVTRTLAAEAVTTDKLAADSISADKISGLGGFVARSSTSSTGTSDPTTVNIEAYNSYGLNISSIEAYFNNTGTGDEEKNRYGTILNAGGMTYL